MKIGTGVSEGKKSKMMTKIRWFCVCVCVCVSMQRAQHSTKQISTLREQRKWRLQEITGPCFGAEV